MNHNTALSILGSHMTRLTSEVTTFSCYISYVKHLCKTLQSVPFLEEFSFPDHVHFKGKTSPWDLYHEQKYEEEDIFLDEYLALYPLPELKYLRKLRFGCIPSHIFRKILKAYSLQLESLEMETSYIPTFPSDFPNLKELTFQITSTKEAFYYLDEFKNTAPLEKLLLIEVTNGHEPRLPAISLCLDYTHWFGNTLKHLEFTFSGNIMWDQHSFSKVKLPVLKSLKLEHCSTVEFELYSKFLLHLKSLQRLTIDKAHCTHRKYGNCSWKNMPRDCESIGCEFRMDLGDSGLWKKLQHLQQFSFRGCGMVDMEVLDRSEYDKYMHGKKNVNFMEIFSSPFILQSYSESESDTDSQIYVTASDTDSNNDELNGWSESELQNEGEMVEAKELALDTSLQPEKSVGRWKRFTSRFKKLMK